MLMESYIEWKWEKFLRNDGKLLSDLGPNYTKHVSAFTHFSYNITK